MKSLDSEVWHACAGEMVQMPPLNSRVYYFPQGHAEHTLGTVDFSGLPRIPPMILCRVSSLKYLADPETDDVYARIRLIPLARDDNVLDDDGFWGNNRSECTSSAKTLTQSDANSGGGFSVPRFLAETIFPRLDYNADPPVQNLIVKDVHGKSWKFRHIYRGTPRRHLLTTGWSDFVNDKKLVVGDLVVFLKAENGDLSVGIRRAKSSGGINGNESTSAWNAGISAKFREFSAFPGDENMLMHKNGGNMNLKEKGRVLPESVLEASYLAANGHPFEVVYYPRASTPEFFVRAQSVDAAFRIRWCHGMRFKMAFETEDLSRISWFNGTITSVRIADPDHWPNSPWRVLQVTWNEPDLVQTVKCVSPWLVKIVENLPDLPLSAFSPPRKKLRLPNHPDFPLDDQFRMPSFSGNPLGPSSPACCLSNDISIGLQGTRHAKYGVPSLDLQLSNKKQIGMLPTSAVQLDPPAKMVGGTARSNIAENENMSCLLSMGNSSENSKRTDGVLLFGHLILTEQQMSNDHQSCNTISEVSIGRGPMDGMPCPTETRPPSTQDFSEILSTDQVLSKQGHHTGGEVGFGTDHCKVFLDSKELGSTIDLSVLASYEELYKNLEHMLGVEISEMLSRIFYHDVTGAVKSSGEEPFSEFAKSARRLTILTQTSSTERKSMGLSASDPGIDSSKQTGAMRISA